MGQLDTGYLERFSSGSNIFIETGTFKGDSLQIALDFGFAELHSIEINHDLFKICSERFAKDAQVNLHHGDSPDVLRTLMPTITDKITFWLDAHASSLLKTTGSDKYGNVALLGELDSIAQSTRNDHTIFIDDCRLFGMRSWDYLPKQSVIDKLMTINPEYKIAYLDGGFTFGVRNPTDDILVAYV